MMSTTSSIPQTQRDDETGGRLALPRVVRSAESLRRILWEHLDRFDVISFDVFDTLLCRRIHPPEIIPRMAAAWLADFPEATGIPGDAQQILARRTAIKRRLRDAAVQVGDDPEYRFSDLMTELIAEFASPALTAAARDDLARQAIEYEFSLERAHAAPVEGMSRLFQELRLTGKRLSLCSDMYLSAEQIRTLLAESGYDVEGVPIYVSGDVRLSKASGRLHAYWLKREGVAPRRAIHIGDNIESDLRTARRHGLHAIAFRDPQAAARQVRLDVLHRRAQGSDFWKGAYVFEVGAPLKALPPGPDFHYDYGRNLLGPVYAVFLHRVLEKVRQKHLQQLLFIAREGFLFKKLYELFAAALLPKMLHPRISYACLSRSSTALTADKPMPHLFGEREGQHALLADYLAQCGFFGAGRRVGLVDVGWKGTIEANLRSIFVGHREFPAITGLYLGRLAPVKGMRLPPEAEEGLIRDPRRGDLGERAVVEFLPLFEEGARAPHGATLGYRRDAVSGRVEPVFEQYATAGDAALAALQQGVVDFAVRYAQAVQGTGYSAEQMMPYLTAHLTRMVCLPRPDEARGLIRFLRHASDAGPGGAAALGIERFRIWRPSDWAALVWSSGPCWRQGTLAQQSRTLSWLFSAMNYLRRWSV